MRSTIGLALVALTLLAVAPIGQARRASALVIRVKSVTTSVVTKDVPPKGYSKGDVYVETDALFNVDPQFGKAARAQVGTDRATLTFRSATLVLVVGTAKLPGGTISFRGIVRFNATTAQSVTVVGGTGRYAHARGTVRSGTQSEPLNTYRLTLL
jgi:hypothetical protein